MPGMNYFEHMRNKSRPATEKKPAAPTFQRVLRSEYQVYVKPVTQQQLATAERMAGDLTLA